MLPATKNRSSQRKVAAVTTTIRMLSITIHSIQRRNPSADNSFMMLLIVYHPAQRNSAINNINVLTVDSDNRQLRQSIDNIAYAIRRTGHSTPGYRPCFTSVASFYLYVKIPFLRSSAPESRTSSASRKLQPFYRLTHAIGKRSRKRPPRVGSISEIKYSRADDA
ncbi:hypothetical protein EVAR_6305_1 [Eumeta japonica]|uniref:Uncharacterized protein n=1 Tax=Eumeta variegata TaxID=151549 RepID=A0A4C1TBR7_EUMVA|nr:hypothetical protein EVAR_6305_1 [Eumeta japonica]